MISSSPVVPPSGPPFEKYRLVNQAGSSLGFLTYGGIVTSICMPDRAGRLENVVLGFDRPEDYLGPNPYFGAITGRIAGRIAHGRLTVEGTTYELARNEARHHLHGGKVGWNRRVWLAAPVPAPEGGAAVQLRHRSLDGEEGYPGTLSVTVTYALTAENAFIITSEVVSDRVTPIAMTHHSYFNLAGSGQATIGDHRLQIQTDRWVPTDEEFILSGRVQPVDAANDFTRERRLGDALPDLFLGHGDFYVLPWAAQKATDSPRLAARLSDPASGRVMEVFTNEPCLQLYTSSSLDGSVLGRGGNPYPRFAGVCLECQAYPGGDLAPELGNAMVKPGIPQHRVTSYLFSAH